MRLTVQRLLLAVALAVSAILFVPAPAQAAWPTMTICFWAVNDDGTWERVCYTIDVPVAGPRKGWPRDCWVCAPSWNFGEDVVNPAEFHERLGKGLALLSQSSLEKDEKLAAQLRDEAVREFYTAAEVLKGSKAPFKEFAWIEPESGKVFADPDPHPWQTAIGSDLEAGISLMQEAVYDPQPVPWIEAAMKHFDQANAALAEVAAT
ncbi:hypothetical protein [Glycomyces sp. NPDC048151]|uniref:hypothetical protein n=1 Tax=Glycomyces sp. NPDC048151 TaxID=3364002 RepID=UPI00371A2BE6